MGLELRKIATRPSLEASEAPGPSFVADLLRTARFDLRARQELLDLSRETDPSMLAEGLFAFGIRQERADHLDSAASVFAALQQNADSFGAASVGIRAGQRLDAILGRGALGNRAEFLLRRFAREAANPSALVGMAG